MGHKETKEWVETQHGKFKPADKVGKFTQELEENYENLLK